MWVRGLKQSVGWSTLQVRHVAPRVGAWIETTPCDFSRNLPYVAPRVGAWIETNNYGQCRESNLVAPRVGAWIET